MSLLLAIVSYLPRFPPHLLPNRYDTDLSIYVFSACMTVILTDSIFIKLKYAHLKYTVYVHKQAYIATNPLSQCSRATVGLT